MTMSEHLALYREPSNTAQSPAPSTEGAPSELKGTMGTVELIFSVLAFAAPLAVVSGLIPFVIIFNGAGAPGAYVAATVVLLLFAVGLAAMSRSVPNPGAFYAYVTSGLGRVAGLGAAFLAVYAYWLLAVASYAFLGSSTAALVSGTFGGPEIAWQWWSLLGIALCGAIGYRNIALSAKVLAIAMALEVLVVLVFDVAVLSDGGSEGLSLAPLGWDAFTSGTVGVAVLFSVLCFLGFESTAIFREEAREPEKTIPRAMYLSVLLVGLFYVAAALMIVLAYGSEQAVTAANEDPAGLFGQAMTRYTGEVLADIVSVLLVTSIFASMVAVQNMLSRYLYSLGQDGTLPSRLGVADPKHRAPSFASLVVTAVIVLGLLPFLIADSDPGLLYGRVAGVGTFSITVLMVLASVAVVAYFRRSPQAGTSVLQTTVAPGLAAIGLAVVLWLAVDNFSTLTTITGAGAVAVVASSFVVLGLGMGLALWFRSNRPHVYERIGRRKL